MSALRDEIGALTPPLAGAYPEHEETVVDIHKTVLAAVLAVVDKHEAKTHDDRPARQALYAVNQKAKHPGAMLGIIEALDAGFARLAAASSPPQDEFWWCDGCGEVPEEKAYKTIHGGRGCQQCGMSPIIRKRGVSYLKKSAL